MNRKHRLAHWLTAVTAGGVCFQFGGCVQGALNVAGNFNPCGTILECNPFVYDFATSGIDGPGLNVDADPFCTFPPYCTPEQDPIYGFFP